MSRHALQVDGSVHGAVLRDAQLPTAESDDVETTSNGKVLKEISARNGVEMDILQTMYVKEVWGAELQEKEAILIR